MGKRRLGPKFGAPAVEEGYCAFYTLELYCAAIQCLPTCDKGKSALLIDAGDVLIPGSSFSIAW